MTSSTIDVLIIGAGPTGLMLACQLSLYYPKISFRIIDKNASGTTQSRAIVVHARSLEVFAQLNIVDKAIAHGEFAEKAYGFFHGKKRFTLDFSTFRTEQELLLTKYPYFLLLEQSATEQILENYLNEKNIQVERNTEAVDLLDFNTENSSGVEVKLDNGEIIQTKYVCACDGARSIVRHKLNLSFGGQTYEESLFLVDCKIDNVPIGKKDLGFFIASSGIIGLFPLTNDRYRMVGTISKGNETKTNISVNEAENLLKQRCRNYDMNIHDCYWTSIYRSHHRHINTFRYRKRYFLLGDAAHIHSPLGGQGMNTGLQDAHNLGWKLAYVLTKSANDRLLDTYHDERSAVAKTLVHTTDRGFAFITSTNLIIRFIRLFIFPYFVRFIIQPLFTNSKRIRQGIFRRISQTGISYRSSSVYDYGASAGTFDQNTPMPGDRFPYVIFQPCYYHLVIFDNQQTAKVNPFVEIIKQRYGDIIKIHDANEENLPVRFEGAMLIRPDGHIAYRTTVFDIHHFQNYFAQFFC